MKNNTNQKELDIDYIIKNKQILLQFMNEGTLKKNGIIDVFTTWRTNPVAAFDAYYLQDGFVSKFDYTDSKKIEIIESNSRWFKDADDNYNYWTGDLSYYHLLGQGV